MFTPVEKFLFFGTPALLFILIFLCCNRETPENINQKDGCSTEYVIEDVFVEINGKKEKIARVQVSKCAIRVIRPKLPRLPFRFSFYGEIIDNTKGKDAPDYSYGMRILYYSLENSKISLANPFKDGYCELKIAYYDEGVPKEINRRYIFSPKKQSH